MTYETWFSAANPPWSQLPDFIDRPTIEPTSIALDGLSLGAIDANQTIYFQGVDHAVWHNDVVDFTNNGLIWAEGDVGEVFAVHARNVDILYNNGSLITIADGVASAYGAYMSSWGVLQNSGSIQVAAVHAGAVGYMSYSAASYGLREPHINSGIIEAWSGATTAVGAILWNGGVFENSGSILARGFGSAHGIRTVFHSAHIVNSGLIEVEYSETPTRAVTAAIYNYDSGSIQVTNLEEGIIRSNDHAIFSQPLHYRPYEIRNSGLIEGDIDLQNGPATIVNTGKIVGDISTDGRDDHIDTREGLLEGKVFLDFGDDTFVGGAFGENVDGAHGDDWIEGGLGNDTIWAGYGADTLFGGEGEDLLRLEGGNVSFAVDLSEQSISPDANGNNIRIDGFEHVRTSYSSDTLTGSDTANDLNGGRGDDLIAGLGGNDTLTGGDGRDIFYFSNLGGADVVTDFNFEEDKFDVTQVNGVFGIADLALVQEGENTKVTFPDGSSALFLNTKNTDLSEKNLIFTGTHRTADATVTALRGGAGNDTLFGLEGNDTIVGGGGNDKLVGMSGHDTIWAGDGDEGLDTVIGGSGNDVLAGGAGNDLIVGGSQNEAIASGSDTVFGGAGNDRIIAGNFLNNEAAATGTSANALWAGSGNDTVTGDDGADVISGGEDDDYVQALAGNDTVFGGRGGGNDIVYGGDGHDLIFVGQGSDQVFGGPGDDEIFSGNGFDRVYGGEGSDTIWGGPNQDEFWGGEGSDTFVFVSNNGQDFIHDFNVAEDKLDLTHFEIASFDDLSRNFGTSFHGLTINLESTKIILVGLSESDLTETAVLL